MTKALKNSQRLRQRHRAPRDEKWILAPSLTQKLSSIDKTLVNENLVFSKRVLTGK